VGGGVAYVRALQAVRSGGGFEVQNDDQLQGVEILLRSIVEPIKCVAENVGVSGEVALNNITTSKYDPQSYGFNAKTHEYEDLMVAGVIDPAKVTRLALENAASVSGMLLTTKSIITYLPQK